MTFVLWRIRGKQLPARREDDKKHVPLFYLQSASAQEMSVCVGRTDRLESSAAIASKAPRSLRKASECGLTAYAKRHLYFLEVHLMCSSEAFRSSDVNWPVSGHRAEISIILKSHWMLKAIQKATCGYRSEAELQVQDNQPICITAALLYFSLSC